MLIDLQQNTLTTVSPYVIAFNSILQMTSGELETYLYRQVEENPLLEFEWPDEEWPISYDRTHGSVSDRKNGSEWEGRYGSVDLYGNRRNLYDHLLVQLEQSSLSEQERILAREIVRLLDTNGRFVDSFDEIANEKGVRREEVEKILYAVQALEPAGVAARSLEECLLLQLRRYDNDPLCERIISEYLPDLSKKHFNHIAKALQVSDEAVRGAFQKILSLDPRPCSEFMAESAPQYIYPDLSVSVKGDAYTLSVRRGSSFSVRINQSYASFSESTADTSVKKYVADQYNKANNLMCYIKQREETIVQIGKLIVGWQAPFLFEGNPALKPMRLIDIAEQARVHESTVSRAIRGKYLLSPRGTHPLSFFFESRATSNRAGDLISPTQIKRKIRDYIDNESETKPLSDQKIVHLLHTDGIDIARRTVAKYRDTLGILSATARKKMD